MVDCAAVLDVGRVTSHLHTAEAEDIAAVVALAHVLESGPVQLLQT